MGESHQGGYRAAERMEEDRLCTSEDEREDFERFRTANDEFFAKKAEYFKVLKEEYTANAEKKKALIEKAKELATSTEWRKTGDKLINLQKEWKQIGVVPRKLGDQLWQEFINACNQFFEARNKANAGTRSTEHTNLEKKKR